MKKLSLFMGIYSKKKLFHQEKMNEISTIYVKLRKINIIIENLWLAFSASLVEYIPINK